ncbi:hypothetical protein BpHYR1_014604 [Brachionus plicatilis]|uniref:Uncharacterized protein n=1 Tax=Brachionus plicatilis TaxID=10195 RepID=A0A3M7PWB5_BRAPC|nr:hypothetical protein BpHYR1_014604 [Brachionus plicatilis]
MKNKRKKYTKQSKIIEIRVERYRKVNVLDNSEKKEQKRMITIAQDHVTDPFQRNTFMKLIEKIHINVESELNLSTSLIFFLKSNVTLVL